MGTILKNKNGVSLVEVTVAALIFAIATTGLFMVLNQQRGASDRAERRLQAAYYAKQLLEELRPKVDQRDWDASPPNWWNLVCDGATYAWPGASPPMAGATVNYQCTEIPGIPPSPPGTPGAGSRQVTLQIQWNEP